MRGASRSSAEAQGDRAERRATAGYNAATRRKPEAEQREAGGGLKGTEVLRGESSGGWASKDTTSRAQPHARPRRDSSLRLAIDLRRGWPAHRPSQGTPTQKLSRAAAVAGKMPLKMENRCEGRRT